jgi:hypothetical protein
MFSDEHQSTSKWIGGKRLVLGIGHPNFSSLHRSFDTDRLWLLAGAPIGEIIARKLTLKHWIERLV